MVAVAEIRETVNKVVPGVGKGVVDYAIKKLGIDSSSTNLNDIALCKEEVIKYIQTLYGSQKSETVKKELLNL